MLQQIYRPGFTVHSSDLISGSVKKSKIRGRKLWYCWLAVTHVCWFKWSFLEEPVWYYGWSRKMFKNLIPCSSANLADNFKLKKGRRLWVTELDFQPYFNSDGSIDMDFKAEDLEDFMRQARDQRTIWWTVTFFLSQKCFMTHTFWTIKTDFYQITSF